jgi:hypothetical protein
MIRVVCSQTLTGSRGGKTASNLRDSIPTNGSPSAAQQTVETDGRISSGPAPPPFRVVKYLWLARLHCRSPFPDAAAA